MIPHITRPDLCVFLEVMNVFIGGTDTTMGVHRNRSWNNWSDKVPQNWGIDSSEVRLPEPQHTGMWLTIDAENDLKTRSENSGSHTSLQWMLWTIFSYRFHNSSLPEMKLRGLTCQGGSSSILWLPPELSLNRTMRHWDVIKPRCDSDSSTLPEEFWADAGGDTGRWMNGRLSAGSWSQQSCQLHRARPGMSPGRDSRTQTSRGAAGYSRSQLLRGLDTQTPEQSCLHAVLICFRRGCFTVADEL